MSQQSEDFIQLVKDVLQSDKPDGEKFENIVAAANTAFELEGMTITSLKANVQMLMQESKDFAKMAKDRNEIIDELIISRDTYKEKAARLEKTLRDEFAMHALNGLLACYRNYDRAEKLGYSGFAWEMADKMMERRNS